MPAEVYLKMFIIQCGPIKRGLLVSFGSFLVSFCIYGAIRQGQGLPDPQKGPLPAQNRPLNMLGGINYHPQGQTAPQSPTDGPQQIGLQITCRALPFSLSAQSKTRSCPNKAAGSPTERAHKCSRTNCHKQTQKSAQSHAGPTHGQKKIICKCFLRCRVPGKFLPGL